ncbi:MAG: SufE family protein [Bacteroidota bacterium]
MSSLQDLVDAFEALSPEDRLPWLIEFGNSMPQLPASLHALRDAGEYIVHECQAPVFLKVTWDADAINIRADVPREAPIARGFVALLQQAFNGSTKEIAATGPADMLAALQIRPLLGMQRQVGLTAIYASLIQQLDTR